MIDVDRFDWPNPAAALLLALTCLVPFNFMPGAAISFRSMTVPVHYLIFFPAGALVLAHAAWTFWRERHVPRLMAWTLALSLSLLASSLIAPSKATALSTTAGFILRCAAAGWMGWLIGRDPARRDRFFVWMPLLALVVAAGAVYEPLSGHYFLFERQLKPGLGWSELWRPWQGVAAGAIGQPLPLGAVLNMMLPVCLWQWNRKKSVVWAIPALVVMLAIVMTYRRSAYVVMAGTLALALMRVDRRRARVLVASAVVLVAAALAVPRVRAHIETRFRPSFTVSELQGGHRTWVYQTTFEIVKAKPWLGIGTRQYESEYLKYAHYDHAVNTQDSQYLRMAAENGLIGLAILVGFLATVVGTLWRLREDDGLPFLASCAGFALMLLVLDGLYWPAAGMTFFLIAGVGCARAEELKKEPLTR